jgi:hypothetical protein
MLNQLSHKRTKFQSLHIDDGVAYQLEKLNGHQLKICDQNISVDENPQTITVDYEYSIMTGFQFRKLHQRLQYRWFKINTITRKLINGGWSNISV